MQHSSVGDFTRGNSSHRPRLSGGGHSENNIRELTKREIDYNINHQYPNGVRVGNIPNHDKKIKRTGNNQSWFPKHWTDNTIKKAGEKALKEEEKHGNKTNNGITFKSKYKKVKLGIIRINGKVATIFPLIKQTGGKNNAKRKV
ncbi:MAG: EndoU domain-containing protein [Clostridia bacterium]|nr:EndoU domain-containing protein [Clostridia bacterium]